MSAVRYAVANDVYATLESGASISIEEYPEGDATKAAGKAERHANLEEGVGSLVIGLMVDVVGGAPHDTVWFHPDQDDRLNVIRRARAALGAAEAALEAVGYRDKAHLPAQD